MYFLLCCRIFLVYVPWDVKDWKITVLHHSLALSSTLTENLNYLPNISDLTLLGILIPNILRNNSSSWGVFLISLDLFPGSDLQSNPFSCSSPRLRCVQVRTTFPRPWLCSIPSSPCYAVTARKGALVISSLDSHFLICISTFTFILFQPGLPITAALICLKPRS